MKIWYEIKEAIQWLYFSYILNAIEKNANAKMTKKK